MRFSSERQYNGEYCPVCSRVCLPASLRLRAPGSPTVPASIPVSQRVVRRRVVATRTPSLHCWYQRWWCRRQGCRPVRAPPRPSQPRPSTAVHLQASRQERGGVRDWRGCPGRATGGWRQQASPWQRGWRWGWRRRSGRCVLSRVHRMCPKLCVWVCVCVYGCCCFEAHNVEGSMMQ